MHVRAVLNFNLTRVIVYSSLRTEWDNNIICLFLIANHYRRHHHHIILVASSLPVFRCLAGYNHNETRPFSYSYDFASFLIHIYPSRRRRRPSNNPALLFRPILQYFIISSWIHSVLRNLLLAKYVILSFRLLLLSQRL